MTTMSEAHLREMIERAAECGARKALARVGLHDEGAANDVGDLRELLSAWRDVKRTALRTAVKFVTAVVLAAIAGAVGLATYTRS